MDFTLTPRHQMFKTLFHEFAQNEVAPLAIELDETHEFPWITVKKMGKLGLFGLPFPKQYGGVGADSLAYVLAVEEIAKVCSSTAVILDVSILATNCIYKFGTEEQKQKYLPFLIKGEKIGAFCLTEPNAGTDAGNQQTVAVLDGDEYVINGSKIFITNGGAAETFVVCCMTDPSKGLKGTSCLIVEKGTPGFSIGTVERKMGLNASSTAELIFEDVRVPKENLLGREGDGFKIAMKGLDGGRIGIGAQALGMAQGALDEAVKYSKERIQFGKPIAKFQAIQWMIADMATEIQAARHLVYHAAVLESAGKPYTKEAAMAKLFASQVAVNCADKAVQIHGGYGYMKEYLVERIYREAKITQIYEGTSEAQRMVIAGQVLGR